VSKKHEAAIERQQYTPKLIPGTCSNCANMAFDMLLPAWMAAQPGVWEDKYKEAKNLRCRIGGFPVKKLGSCAEHAFKADA
jgi:hypothetical protein